MHVCMYLCPDRLSPCWLLRRVGSTLRTSFTSAVAYASLMTRLMPPLRNVLAMLAAADWRCVAQLLKHGQGMLTAVLQSMLSPLEMGACIAVVDGSDAKNGIRIHLAVTSLFFALCDWHVPLFISYHNFICRFLSAICMQALFPYSLTLTCLAFLYPTFGKRAHSM